MVVYESEKLSVILFPSFTNLTRNFEKALHLSTYQLLLQNGETCRGVLVYMYDN